MVTFADRRQELLFSHAMANAWIEPRSETEANGPDGRGKEMPTIGSKLVLSHAAYRD